MSCCKGSVRERLQQTDTVTCSELSLQRESSPSGHILKRPWQNLSTITGPRKVSWENILNNFQNSSHVFHVQSVIIGFYSQFKKLTNSFSCTLWYLDNVSEDIVSMSGHTMFFYSRYLFSSHTRKWYFFSVRKTGQRQVLIKSRNWPLDRPIQMAK